MTTTVLKHLTFGGFTVKDADKGEIEAKVATLEVVDKDGDIIRKSALPKAATVAMSAWGHDAVFGARPAGSGKLKTEGRHLVFDGRAFLTTWNGKETFETLKQYPEAEWSFGFRITGWEDPDEDERKAGAWRVITKMEAFEVSPVLIGAGLGTGTSSLKSESATLSQELSAAIHAEVRLALKTALSADAGFEMGARVKVKAGRAHDAMTAEKTGTVAEVSTPALGITFDGMEGTHRWYVADELESADADDGEDHPMKMDAETARLAAEQQAAAAAALEAVRLEADMKTKAEEETKAQQRIADTAQREFERFKRTMARVA
jgi:hypothetical protein